MNKSHTKHKHLRSVEYDLHEDLAKLKTALADATYDVKGKAGQVFADSYERFKNKSSDWQDGAATYIAEKPFKTISIAFLSGMVIGFLLRK
jgi:ElaB/YqjD/DUF883 family membrane-anchored ribosome-binding protein